MRVVDAKYKYEKQKTIEFNLRYQFNDPNFKWLCSQFTTRHKGKGILILKCSTAKISKCKNVEDVDQIIWRVNFTFHCQYLNDLRHNCIFAMTFRLLVPSFLTLNKLVVVYNSETVFTFLIQQVLIFRIKIWIYYNIFSHTVGTVR